MSRRTERPYKVDGADKLARHSAVRCSAPEINGPVVQREFRFLLRETCNCAPSETAGARVSNGPRAFAGVSRGRSTESNEPGDTGGPHNSGRAEPGRQNTTIGGLVPGAMKPMGRALGSDHRGRERVAALSVRTARNRRTRTRMSGGVGARRGNPPGDPIRLSVHASESEPLHHTPPAMTCAARQNAYHAISTKVHREDRYVIRQDTNAPLPPQHLADQQLLGWSAQVTNHAPWLPVPNF